MPILIIQLHVITPIAILRYAAYGFFGVLYSTSFWNGFQTVS